MSSPITIGQVIKNRYRVEEYLGGGGMAAVYRVWDTSRNVPLAMKVLHSDLAEDETASKSFLREIDALRDLNHPHIVTLYGYGHTDDFDFLLLEFVNGPTLKQVLKNQAGQPLAIQEILIVFKAISAALGYAHTYKKGYVHCDVKPGNVMIDSGGTVYLTDFGITRYADSSTTTLAGAGAPAYMAPEQIRGEPVTAATDIYAMGIMLFEMLTGQRPFRGDDGSGGSRGRSENIRLAHLTKPPPDPRTFNSAISPTLSAVLLKALEKNPKDRFQDTMTFFSAFCSAAGVSPDQIPDRLLKYTRKEPPSLPPPPITTPNTRARILLFILGAAGLVIVSLRGYYIWQKSISTPEPTSNLTNTSLIVPATTQPVMITSTPTRTPTRAQPSQPSNPTLQPGATQISDKDGMVLSYIPAGTFQMGEDSNRGLEECRLLYEPYITDTCELNWFIPDEPAHMVSLSAFYVDMYEVTNGQYAQCVAAGACTPPENPSSSSRSNYYGNPSFSSYPVIRVNWFQAQDYCSWAGRRLPTEAEWEYAARGGPQGKSYQWGDSFNGNLANFCDVNCVEEYANTDYNDGHADTAPIGSYPANGYGLYDMPGNVLEWVWDWYDRYDTGLNVDPTGPNSGIYRVMRDGSWAGSGYSLRNANRNWAEPDYSSNYIGFRCAMLATYQPVTSTPTRVPPAPSPTPISSAGSVTGFDLAFASDRNGDFNIVLMNTANRSVWKNLPPPDDYELAWWPSFCGPYVAGEVADLNGSLPQWIYLTDPDQGSSRLWEPITAGPELGVPRCSPNGEYLAYSSGGGSEWNLLVARFDGTDPFLVDDNGFSGYASWLINNNGLYSMAGISQSFNLRYTTNLLQPTNTNIQTITPGKYPAVSPDGRQVAYICGGDQTLCLWNVSSGSSIILHATTNGVWHHPITSRNILIPASPAWSFDGQWIYFSSAEDGDMDIYRIRPDGSGLENITADWPSNELMPALQW